MFVEIEYNPATVIMPPESSKWLRIVSPVKVRGLLSDDTPDALENIPQFHSQHIPPHCLTCKYAKARNETTGYCLKQTQKGIHAVPPSASFPKGMIVYGHAYKFFPHADEIEFDVSADFYRAEGQYGYKPLPDDLPCLQQNVYTCS